jgi:hypothetical protein
MSFIAIIKNKDKPVPDFFSGSNPEVKKSYWTTEVPSTGIDYTGEELFSTTVVSSIANQLSCYVLIIPSENREGYKTKILEDFVAKENFEDRRINRNIDLLSSPQIPREVINFAISKKIDREFDLITEVICNCFTFNKLEFELVSDYETDFQQICFSLYLNVSYSDLVKLRRSFYQKLNRLNMPIEKEKYFVFEYEREEP